MGNISSSILEQNIKNESEDLITNHPQSNWYDSSWYESGWYNLFFRNKS